MGKNKQKISKLEETVYKLLEEEQSKLDILSAMNDGVIVFEKDLTIKHINVQAYSLLKITPAFDPYKDSLRLFKNRKANLSFNLANWLDCIKEELTTQNKEIKIWYSHPKTLIATQLLLSARVLLNKKGQLKHILLIICDQSMNAKALEQKRLFQAAFNGFNSQFITNDKGFIIEANNAFLKMTGKSKKRLKKTTILQWIEESVEWENSAESFINVVLKKRFWTGEVQIYTDDSSMIHAAMSISMIMDRDNNLEFFVVNIQNISDIKEAHRQIEHMAFYDGLTGLPNRKLITQHINTLIQHNQANKTFASILNINLDRFKSINDAFGRVTGDRFLKRITITISSVLRTNDYLARVNGDEFIVATQDKLDDPEKVLRKSLQLANKILKSLNHHFLVDNLTLNTSARIGIIIYPGDEHETAENLLIKTDLAVSEAKNVNHKNKVYIYQSILTEEAKHKRQLENDLTQATPKGEFELHFQAQINANQEVIGAEALLRWQHPIHGLISPNVFIPIAEESRQIIQIGNWVMKEAFSQARVWSESYPFFNVGVNVSPIQFHEAEFLENVEDNLKISGVNPNNITLELTENVFISDTNMAFEKISRLDKLGFKVSIDDFGTGYSSLSYFQKLPIHELKIDKSFIEKIPDSSEAVTIIELIMHLATTKKLKIIAEGVETKQQIEFLHEKNQNILIQGFYYSQPCSTADFIQQFFDKK